ncbi:hypothetical protein ACFTZB_40130 [Rhodococcus sp. NPDC057014]|uniref:hypothetical protein n=1 Tax=unclassified Rhodococcus (in: high G+C Gram-positive bacteria) TaxID=192944 RepID=UPI0036421772
MSVFSVRLADDSEVVAQVAWTADRAKGLSVPTDTSAAAGRNSSKMARAQLLSTAVALLAEQYGCGQEAAFDALLDIAHRNHASVAGAAEHVLSRESTVDGRKEQQGPRDLRQTPHATTEPADR